MSYAADTRRLRHLIGVNSFAIVPRADGKLLKPDLLPLEASFYYVKRGVKAVRVPTDKRSADGASKAIFLHRDGNAQLR